MTASAERARRYLQRRATRRTAAERNPERMRSGSMVSSACTNRIRSRLAGYRHRRPPWPDACTISASSRCPRPSPSVFVFNDAGSLAASGIAIDPHGVEYALVQMRPRGGATMRCTIASRRRFPVNSSGRCSAGKREELSRSARRSRPRYPPPGKWPPTFDSTADRDGVPTLRAVLQALSMRLHQPGRMTVSSHGRSAARRARTGSGTRYDAVISAAAAAASAVMSDAAEFETVPSRARKFQQPTISSSIFWLPRRMISMRRRPSRPALREVLLPASARSCRRCAAAAQIVRDGIGKWTRDPGRPRQALRSGCRSRSLQLAFSAAQALHVERARDHRQMR